MTVSIAQLKNGLSGYLQRVRARGIKPLTGDISAEEAELAAAGLLTLPAEPFDPNLKTGTRLIPAYWDSSAAAKLYISAQSDSELWGALP